MTHPVSSTLPAQQRPRPQKQRGHHPPGPLWYTAARNTLSFLHNALDLLLEIYKCYGDVVSVHTLVGPFTLIFHPDGMRHVLQENHLNYNKDVPDYHVLSLVLGKGLLTNDGGSWLKQRRLILATILSRYQLRHLSGTVVTPESLVTLRPRGDLLMTVRRRPELKQLLSYQREG